MTLKNRIQSLEYIQGSELQDNKGNWRIHSKAQKSALHGIMDDIGIAGALLVYHSDRQGGLVVIDGHMRKGEFPDDAWPCLLTDLTDNEADIVLSTYDPLGFFAETDKEKLSALLSGLQTENDQLLSLIESLRSVANIPVDDDSISPESVPDAQEPSDELLCQWGVKETQLWELGRHRLFCGDSRDRDSVYRLMGGEMASLMTADPPYGDSWVSKAKDMQSKGYGHSHAVLHGSIEFDDLKDNDLYRFICDFLIAAKNIRKNAFPYYVWHRSKRLVFEQALVDSGYFVHQPVCWVKPSFVIGRLHYHPRMEFAFHGWIKGKGKCPFFGKKNQSDVWEVSRENDKIHPTQKPVELYSIPIQNHTRKNEIVYDPFCGSGTSIMAAEISDRRCFALEISPHYVAVILQRFSDLTGKVPLRILEVG